MEKLINLRHPDISNTSRLKMPLHLSKLKCLQVIVGAKFLLGGSCGWRMEDLGELHNLERRVSALRKLSIKDCPKLLGKFPENLCSLAKLRISGCPELNLETPIQLSSLKRFEVVGSRKAGVVFDEAELFTSQLDGMKQIEELDISHCNSLTSLPTSTLPSTLKKIRIESCQKLKLEAPDSSKMNSNMFLEFLIPNGTETLDISWCENLEILLSVACGTQMTSLDIHDCKKLKWLPERMQELLPSLKKLQLSSCLEIESFPDGRLPVNLPLLEIIYCEKLVNGQGVASTETPLSQSVSLLEQGLPSSVSKLAINDCPNLQSVPESALPSSLSKLTIEDCPNLQSLPVKGMPSSLSKLSIRYCPLLKPLLEFDKREYWSKIAHIPDFGNNILAQLVKGKTITSSVICQETVSHWGSRSPRSPLACGIGEFLAIKVSSRSKELFNLVFAVLNPSILGIAGKSMNCQKLCNQKLNRYGTYGSNESQRYMRIKVV
ncbi:hypothetical protein CQW23_27061 [Capsicum baccatum]|uniref:Uncharacterized protein n=1 Tax=Capsicum baccatum TaxID=33114 RepID=A0A2G2VQL2_CAPBA|nr:hypothetical protein CQW23_27061 [Capsicum baccatum]